MDANGRARLLPWVTDDGKACLLSPSDSGGFLSRLADEFETAQVVLSEETLSEAKTVLEDVMSPHAEVRYTGIRLAECLADLLRIAESRRLRLPGVGDEGSGS
ncbi:hypothetical protein [Streptomyces parvus]|uniref:Uncharacterized protein n=1 Tax=Streptomyces parvus TaxID=66428 RepID=A0A7K3S7H5_9ACTN|nr:hypothetical protein [Streptomyces parvus]NEC22772.1 hypothetical protein [Streptomyces parvus]